MKANQALKPKINEKSKQGEEGKGLGLLLVSFATSTTAHGLNRIAGSTDFRIRVCWFIVWLGVMIGFVVMIVKLGILYTSKPVSTSISISYHEVRLHHYFNCFPFYIFNYGTDRLLKDSNL